MPGGNNVIGGGSTLPATAILCIVAASVYGANLADPDYYFHLKTGELIVGEWRLPKTDPFLLTQGESPWVLHEWLFQVALHLVFSEFGAIGVRILTATLFGLCVAVTYLATARYLPLLGALALTVFAAQPLFVGLAPRPQLVTYLLFAVYLYVLYGYVRDGRQARLWFLPLMMILWANLHGGFAVGIVLECLVLASLMIMRRLGNWGSSGSTVALRPLAMVTVATVVAGAATPYHVAHYAYPFSVSGLWVTQLITEWQPPILASPPLLPFLLLITLWIVSQILRNTRPSILDLTLGFAFVGLALTALRHVPLAALVLVVGTARALADGAWRDFQGHASRLLRPMLSRATARDASHLSRNAERTLNALVLLSVLVALAFALNGRDERQLSRANSIVGWKAVEYFRESGLRGRVFNEYSFGGYFTFRMWPEVKAFIDGRADVYPDEFSKDYVRMFTGAEGWKELFAKHDFDHVLVSRSAPLRQLLIECGDFVEVYADDDNVVLSRVR